MRPVPLAYDRQRLGRAEHRTDVTDQCRFRRRWQPPHLVGTRAQRVGGTGMGLEDQQLPLHEATDAWPRILLKSTIGRGQGIIPATLPERRAADKEEPDPSERARSTPAIDATLEELLVLGKAPRQHQVGDPGRDIGREQRLLLTQPLRDRPQHGVHLQDLVGPPLEDPAELPQPLGVGRLPRITSSL